MVLSPSSPVFLGPLDATEQLEMILNSFEVPSFEISITLLHQFDGHALSFGLTNTFLHQVEDCEIGLSYDSFHGLW